MTVQEFIIGRRAGAAKIAREARAKGGLSLLTAVHFEAKDSAYVLALSVVNGPFSARAIVHFKFLEQTAASVIATAGTMNVFQVWAGKQEVYGEILAFIGHPEDVFN